MEPLIETSINIHVYGPTGDVLAGSSYSMTRIVDSPSPSIGTSSDLALSTARSFSAHLTGFVALASDDVALQDPLTVSLHEDGVDRPDPIASRLVTERDEGDHDDDESSSKAIGDVIILRPIVRGKSIDHMAKQTLVAASTEVAASKPGLGHTISNGNLEHDEGHDDDISREDINDVANKRQLRPYHDLSTASDEFIRRRRECILQARAEQMGSSYTPASVSLASNIQPGESWSFDGSTADNVLEDETRVSLKASLSRASTLSIDGNDQSIDLGNDGGEDSIGEEYHPPTIRLSKRQATLAAKGKLKLPPYFADETSEEKDEDGLMAPPKRGRRAAARQKRSGSGSGRFVKGKGGPKKAEFPFKVHKMLDEADPDIVTWLPHGRAFRVNDTESFVETVLPEYGFKQSKITSFYRQLNLYGFSRIIKGRDAGGYFHECFLRGKPALIKGMVRVKVKGGGDRPKPSEIAKTQPNFYDMPPIDSEAEACAARGTGKSEETANESKISKAPKKKRKSKSPVPLTELKCFEPIAFDTGMVEDNSSPAPSRALLEYHRQHPPSDTNPIEITPSPTSMPSRVFDPSSSQTSFHTHILPPPLYTKPPIRQDSALRADFPSSTFHMHHNMTMKQQQATFTRSIMTFPTVIAQCTDQQPGKSSNQKASDAELLVEDWYNINRPSPMAPRTLGHGTDAGDDMWLPDSPINVHVDEEQPVNYLETIENAKSDVEFGRVLDAFLDSL